MNDTFGPPIYCYSRAQALADGVLVDVSPLAAKMGFLHPTVITSAVFEALETIPAGSGQDFKGRLNDVLWMARCAIKRADSGANRVEFDLYLDGEMRELTRLMVHLGPGDDPSPVFTIGYPSDF